MDYKDHLNDSLKGVLNGTYNKLIHPEKNYRTSRVSVFELLIVASVVNRMQQVAPSKTASSLFSLETAAKQMAVYQEDLHNTSKMAVDGLGSQASDRQAELIMRGASILLKMALLGLEQSAVIMNRLPDNKYSLTDILAQSLDKANLIANFKVRPKPQPDGDL